MKQFKKGDKVKYLGSPGVITNVKDYNGKTYYSVSYNKGTGRTKASDILSTDGSITELNEQRPMFQDTPNEFAYLDFKKWAYKNRSAVRNILLKALKDNRGDGTYLFLALRQVWLAWANKKAKQWSSIPNKGPQGKDFGRALAVMMKKDNLIIKRSGNKLTTLENKHLLSIYKLNERIYKLNEKLARGLKPLLQVGTTINKKVGEDALMKLSDKFDRIDDENADNIASHLNMAIELMQDGYAGQATRALKAFNKACKDVLRGKSIKSAFEGVNEAKVKGAIDKASIQHLALDYLKGTNTLTKMSRKAYQNWLKTLKNSYTNKEAAETIIGLVTDAGLLPRISKSKHQFWMKDMLGEARLPKRFTVKTKQTIDGTIYSPGDYALKKKRAGGGIYLNMDKGEMLGVDARNITKLEEDKLTESMIGIQTKANFKPNQLKGELERAGIKGFQMNRLSVTMTALKLDKKDFEKAKKIIDSIPTAKIQMAKENNLTERLRFSVIANQDGYQLVKKSNSSRLIISKKGKSVEDFATSGDEKKDIIQFYKIVKGGKLKESVTEGKLTERYTFEHDPTDSRFHKEIEHFLAELLKAIKGSKNPKAKSLASRVKSAQGIAKKFTDIVGVRGGHSGGALGRNEGKLTEAKIKKGDAIKMDDGEYGVVNKVKGKVAYIKLPSMPGSFHPIEADRITYKGKHKGKDLYSEIMDYTGAGGAPKTEASDLWKHFDAKMKLQDTIMDLEYDMKMITKDLAQLHKDMEQEAEPEGGPKATRYGRDIEKKEKEYKKKKAEFKKLMAKLDRMEQY